jgi:gliding motility-associated-like protein
MNKDNHMEPDNSHIGKQFRDAFAEFKQEPSPELWNKIATHPDFPLNQAKPGFKWVKIVAGSAALVAIVSIVIFTMLPTRHNPKAELKEVISSVPVEQTTTATTLVSDQNQTSEKQSETKNQNPSQHNPVSNGNSVIKQKEFSIAENTPVVPTRTGKQLVIPTNPSLSSQKQANIFVQRPAATTSDHKELQTSPNSSEPISASSDTMLCLGESMKLHAQGGDFYSWSTGETGSFIQINPTELTTYTVTITNQSGRQLIKDIHVKVVDCQPLAIPNAFTPNADGINDIFEVYGNDIQDFSMIILTRTGQIVFESKDIKAGWDGSIKGKPAELGVYIYRIQFKDQNGTERKQNGQITLLR